MTARNDFNEENPRSPRDPRERINRPRRGRGEFQQAFGGPMPVGGRGRHRIRRQGRGDVRSALLMLIAEEPRHGYALMQAIEERTNGAWRPSPGSIYPVLQQVQDEGLVRLETDESGRGIAHLTDAGQAFIDENGEKLDAVWDSVGDHGTDAQRDIRLKYQGLTMAWKQVIQAGTPAQLMQASKVLEDTQRRLYAVLAQAPESAE